MLFSRPSPTRRLHSNALLGRSRQGLPVTGEAQKEPVPCVEEVIESHQGETQSIRGLGHQEKGTVRRLPGLQYRQVGLACFFAETVDEALHLAVKFKELVGEDLRRP